MRQTAIAFRSGKLTLEGVLSISQELAGPFPALLVCHPLPTLGGDMDNPVVTAICRRADREALATLRFNFRGVGDSEGEYGGGEEEQKDVRAALDVLRRWPGLDRKRLGIAGYSFGASVIAKGFRRYRHARCFAFIAPPVASIERSASFGDSRPKLFVAGQHDRISVPVALQRVLDGFKAPVQFAEIAGADHSLRGRETEVADHVVEFALAALK
jgi:alpha/beta superfamily hydrolase